MVLAPGAADVGHSRTGIRTGVRVLVPRLASADVNNGRNGTAILLAIAGGRRSARCNIIGVVGYRRVIGHGRLVNHGRSVDNWSAIHHHRRGGIDFRRGNCGNRHLTVGALDWFRDNGVLGVRNSD